MTLNGINALEVIALLIHKKSNMLKEKHFLETYGDFLLG